MPCPLPHPIRSTTRPAPALGFACPGRPAARWSLRGSGRLRRGALRGTLSWGAALRAPIRLRYRRGSAKVCELLTQLFQLSIERIDLIACRQPERAHHRFRLLTLLCEQRGGSVGELCLEVGEICLVHRRR